MFPGYRAAPHHALLAEALEAVEQRQVRRLMVCMPPRHGKSELVSVRFPAWYLGRNPGERFIGTSYAARLAERFSGQARNQLVDPRWPHPDVRLLPGSQSRATWDTTQGGGFAAAGVGGPITGGGADVLLIDDPVKNQQEADSEARRDTVWDWYTSTATTRLQPDGAVVLVLTRWHEDDLAGRLLAEQAQGGDQWELLTLPALAEEGDALGRELGAPLWPEKFPTEVLEERRAVVGTRVWNALYQQRPRDEEGALFKRHWLGVVQACPPDLRWARYWDLAASQRTSGDYTASAAVALGDDGTLYVRDMVRGRWEWPDAKRIIRSTMLAEGPATQHYIEEALHGLAAVQELRRDRELAHLSLRGVRVTKDKVARAHSWSARAEAGKVRLVSGPWCNEFIAEATGFPMGAHDDQVDSVSGGVEALSHRREWLSV
jgi:predicted phage terminase large subunit-like protein